jgi:hypothetical protein
LSTELDDQEQDPNKLSVKSLSKAARAAFGSLSLMDNGGRGSPAGLGGAGMIRKKSSFNIQSMQSRSGSQRGSFYFNKKEDEKVSATTSNSALHSFSPSATAIINEEQRIRNEQQRIKDEEKRLKEEQLTALRYSSAASLSSSSSSSSASSTSASSAHNGEGTNTVSKYQQRFSGEPADSKNNKEPTKSSFSSSSAQKKQEGDDSSSPSSSIPFVVDITTLKLSRKPSNLSSITVNDTSSTEGKVQQELKVKVEERRKESEVKDIQDRLRIIAEKKKEAAREREDSEAAEGKPKQPQRAQEYEKKDEKEEREVPKEVKKVVSSGGLSKLFPDSSSSSSVVEAVHSESKEDIEVKPSKFLKEPSKRAVIFLLIYVVFLLTLPFPVAGPSFSVPFILYMSLFRSFTSFLSRFLPFSHSPLVFLGVLNLFLSSR